MFVFRSAPAVLPSMALTLTPPHRRAPPGKSRIVAFARSVLELAELGELALKVLDGGVFAGRRSLELALQVIALADAAAARTHNRRSGDK